MTELIWDGKYDKDGKRVAPLRVSLPFQTVETVNKSVQQRQMALDMFSAGRDPEWRNRLIWGDKKYVLPSLLDEFAGKVNLIYIDPPFNVGADFSFTATIADNPETTEDEATEFVESNQVLLNRKPIVIHGEKAWILTCSGSLKPQRFYENYLRTMAVYTFISIGTWFIM